MSGVLLLIILGNKLNYTFKFLQCVFSSLSLLLIDLDFTILHVYVPFVSPINQLCIPRLAHLNISLIIYKMSDNIRDHVE